MKLVLVVTFQMKFQLGVDDPTKGWILDGFESNE